MPWAAWAGGATTSRRRWRTTCSSFGGTTDHPDRPEQTEIIANTGDGGIFRSDDAQTRIPQWPPFRFTKGFPSEKTVTPAAQTTRQVVLSWVVLGTTNDLMVKALVRADDTAIYDGLVLQTVAAKETAPEAWDCQAESGVANDPKEYEYKFAFDTTGGKQKITQAKEHIASYPQREHRRGPPGCDRCHGPRRGRLWNRRAEVQLVRDLAIAHRRLRLGLLPGLEGGYRPGQRRQWFRGFSAGQVALSRRQGIGLQQRPVAHRDHLHVRAERQRLWSVTIGTISGVSKAGWQYLWVHYQETRDDQTAKKFVHRPDAVYVERVYDAASFDLLGNRRLTDGRWHGR